MFNFVRLVAMFTLLIVCAVPAMARQPKLLMYLPFDGQTTPRDSAVDAHATIHGELAYRDGVIGKAVVVGGANRILYDAAGRFNSKQGTCMFWAAPLDWDANTPTFQFLVSMTSRHKKPTDMLLYKVFNNPNLTFLVRRQGSAQRKLERSIFTWRKNQWHHVAVTWDDQYCRLYIDGQKVAQQSGIKLPPDKWAYVVLGTAYPSWAKLGNEKTAIDELRIYDTAMSDDAIAQRYIQQRDQNPALVVAAQRRQEHMDRMKKDNIASAASGAAVITSSFANDTAYYSDNLIDTSLDTAWKSFNDELPQWIELRWAYPMQMDTLVFDELPPSRISAFTIEAWDRVSQWKSLSIVQQTSVDNRTECRFNHVITDRLRLVISGNEGPFTQLSEIQVYGPPQPRVAGMQPYWRGWHIWYPEPEQKVVMEPRFFRTTFDLPTGAALDSAFIQLYTNDLYEVFINGQAVGSGFKDMLPVNVTNHVRAGSNCIAIKVTPTSQPAWPQMSMTCQLTLNTSSGTRYIDADDTWKVASKVTAGWMLADDDARQWSKPLMVARVGKGIYGRIGYADRSARERVTVRSVQVLNEAALPGDEVTVRLHLRPEKPLKGDYVLVYKVGEKSVVSGWGDYTVCQGVFEPTPSTAAWPTDRDTVLEITMTLPAWSPHGTSPLHISALNRKGDTGLALIDISGKVLDTVGEIKIDRFGSSAPTPMLPSKSSSRIEGSRLFIDGQRTVPFLHAYLNPTYEKLHLSSKTSVHLYQVRTSPVQLDGSPQSMEKMYEVLNQNIRAVTQIDRDARVLVFIDARPSAVWRQNHPQALLTTAWAKTGPQSYFSQEHLAMVASNLRQVIRRIQSMPYAHRVFGYHMLTCGTPDSVIGGVEDNLFQTDRTKLTLGDYNPQAITAFQNFLRKKYDNSVEQLRAAWREDTAAFETARPINDLLLNNPTDGGVFRDPTLPGMGVMSADYFEFFSGGMEKFMLALGNELKQEFDGNKILGTYYGYDVETLRGYNSVGSVIQNNNFANRQMYGSNGLDYHTLVPTYSHRLAGQQFDPSGAIASMRLHGKLYLAELDVRTFTAVARRWGRQRSATESVEVLKHYLGGLIMEGQAGWFADWSAPGLRGVGYFSDPQVLEVIAKARDIYEQTLEVDRTSKAEIAVIISGKAWFYHDVYNAPPIYNNLIARVLGKQLPHIGAPYDVYRLKDLGEDFVQSNYKLYIFINSFVLDDADRKAITALKENNKTLLWFYAPGYVDRNTGLDIRKIAQVTEMVVGKKNRKEQMEFNIQAIDHPLLKGIDAGTKMGVVPYGYTISNTLHSPSFGPVFYIDDPDATSLARYPDGRTAMAVKGKSIYCAVPYMNAALLRNVARFAGVHLYCKPGPIVKRTGPFVMVHVGFDQKTVTLRLPQPAVLTDLFNDEVIVSDNATFELSSKTSKTWLLRLGK